MRLSLALTVAAFVTVGLAAPAEAGVNKGKVRKVVEAAGLMGWAAQDCARAPSADNVWERFFVDEEGYVVGADMEAGADAIPSYVVETRRLRNGDVWMRMEIDLGEPDLTQTYRLDGARRRVWTMKNAEGTLVVDQGRWTTEPGESVWLTRCPDGPIERED